MNAIGDAYKFTVSQIAFLSHEPKQGVIQFLSALLSSYIYT